MPVIKYDYSDPVVGALQRVIARNGISLKKLSLAMKRTPAFWSRKLGKENRQRRSVSQSDIEAACRVMKVSPRELLAEQQRGQTAR